MAVRNMDAIERQGNMIAEQRRNARQIREDGFWKRVNIIKACHDEGNSFHELFYGFSPCKDAIGDDSYMYPYGVTPQQADKEYITLG